ncbi:MAG: hypothetical protein H0U98_05895 [Alphaproteobacteria bacterium]|nr:hypothetical protein [Alphaproteobacteria bacterium]
MTLDRPAQINIGAAAALMLACLFAFYRWHYSQEARASAGMQTLSDMLRIEAETASAAKPLVGGTAGATVPELLSRIQEIASQYNVAVRSVAPNPADANKMTLGIHGEHRDMMLFLGRLETFQVTISGFEFASDETGIAGTVELTHSGKPGAPVSFADYMDAIIKFTAVRNPFEIGDPVPVPNVKADLGDLSWTYHLTSISLYGAERTATIDAKDYRVGDTLNGMQVSAIGPSSVSLTVPHQPLVQKLHFRRNPGDTAHGD